MITVVEEKILGLIEGDEKPDPALYRDGGKRREAEIEIERDAERCKRAILRAIRCNLHGTLRITMDVSMKDGVPSRKIKIQVTEQFVSI